MLITGVRCDQPELLDSFKSFAAFYVSEDAVPGNTG